MPTFIHLFLLRVILVKQPQTNFNNNDVNDAHTVFYIVHTIIYLKTSV